MFLLKKIISPLFMPLSIVLVFFLTGLAMLGSDKRRHAARKILTATFVGLLLMSYGFISYVPLERLEYLYPPLDINIARSQNIKWIVVLAGGYDESVIRLVEGIRIYKCLPGSRLLVSGGRVYKNNPEPESTRMAIIASGLGVSSTDIVQENMSRDTKDEARIIKSMLGNKKFILVTSAYHMPRSMLLFRAQGMNPIAAPTGYHIHKEHYTSPNSFFPRSDKIKEVEIVLHEVLGIVSAKIMGQI